MRQPQEPRPSVGHFELRACANERVLGGDVVGVENLRDEALVWRVAGHARVGCQRPRAMHRGMPVDAAVKSDVIGVFPATGPAHGVRQRRGDLQLSSIMDASIQTPFCDGTIALCRFASPSMMLHPWRHASRTKNTSWIAIPARIRSRRAASAAIAAAAFGSGFSQPRRCHQDAKTLKLHTARGVHVINTEITETQEEKAMGLMFRTSLADDAGHALLLRSAAGNHHVDAQHLHPARHGLHSRRRHRASYRGLDAALLGKHHLLRRHVAACLELAGGAAERLGLKPGDRVEHALFKSRKK